ncbi:uncharacterized protein LOC143859392 [Tasmannia lanceolata]|uniref:uncharacterized protein LOC143859392 n=1 Tax=Tasmannia lanceolata TaxID=3420 RepID=UPI004062D8A7
METSADDGKGKYAVDEGKGKNASWTSSMDLVLLQALRHEAIEGGKIPNGFKKSAYKYALLEVNQACGTDLTFEQVKNHVKTMKANYRIVAEMLATSGFGWDEEKKKIVVTRDVAMEYLKSYPNRKRYFSQRHDFYEEMAEIFGDEYAHGTYKKTNKNVTRPSEEEAYVVNVANKESEYTEHTSSQFDFIGTGSQYDDMPSYIPTEEMPQVPSPRRTSPPEVGQRSQRTATRTPMETSAAAGGSQSVASSKRKKRGVCTFLREMRRLISNARMLMVKNKFYVVFKGRQVGVYDSWQHCHVQVNGFSGACFRSYRSREEAEADFNAFFHGISGRTKNIKEDTNIHADSQASTSSKDQLQWRNITFEGQLCSCIRQL